MSVDETRKRSPNPQPTTPQPTDARACDSRALPEANLMNSAFPRDNSG